MNVTLKHFKKPSAQIWPEFAPTTKRQNDKILQFSSNFHNVIVGQRNALLFACCHPQPLVSPTITAKEKTDGGWARDDERKSAVFAEGQRLFVQTKLGRQCNSQLPWLRQILSGGMAAGCAATLGPIISGWLSVCCYMDILTGDHRM